MKNIPLKQLINMIKTNIYNQTIIESININNKELYNKLIYIYCKFEKYDKGLELYELYKDIFKQDEGTIYCMTQIYCALNFVDKASEILLLYNININIRHYFYILKYYSNNDKLKLMTIYTLTRFENLKLREEEIELFLKPELKTEFLYIMNHVKEYHYSFSIGLFNKIKDIFGIEINFINGYNKKFNINLKLIDIDESIRKDLYTKININNKKEQLCILHKYFNSINLNNINYIIDGANLGYSKQLDKNLNYKLIDGVLKQLDYKVILFLHKKHNNNTYIKKWTSMNILYRTEINENDDLYWIYSSLYLNIPIITNDILRDHYYKLEHNINFNIWRENNIINYSIISKNQINLNKLPKYSNQTQIINNMLIICNTNYNKYLYINL